MKYENIKNPHELLDFMNNIKYGFVSDNNKKYYDVNSEEWNNDWYNHAIVQDKDGVVNSLCGTCYDQVELERAWFNEHKYSFKTYFMWFYVCRPNNIPSHTFLIYKEKDKYYLFEHADLKNMGIYEFNNENDAIEFVKNNLIRFVYSGNCDIKEEEKDTLKIYEYDKPISNMHIEDYLDFVTSKEIGDRYER